MAGQGQAFTGLVQVEALGLQLHDAELSAPQAPAWCRREAW